MEQANSPAPESVDEAAGRCAAKLTTQFIERHRLTPLPAGGINAYDLQETLIRAFHQGAHWMQERALQIISGPIPPANRRPL